MSILSILEPSRRPDEGRSLRGLPATVGADLLVPTLAGEVVSYANLDHAASPPCLQVVKDAVSATLDTYGSVHRGTGYASVVTTRWYDEAREEMRCFTGARGDDTVIFTRHATEALGLLGKVVPERSKVLVWESEHHAALLAWPEHDVVRLPVPNSADDIVTTLERALRESPVSLVVTTAASSVTGEIWPVDAIVETAHHAGARVCVDASQLAPHRRLAVADADIDYLVLSGHKIYAPFGAGLLVGRSDWLAAAAPHLRGGGAASRVCVDSVEWASGPARHEGGTPNVVGVVAMAAAARCLVEYADAVARHEDFLFQRLVTGVDAVPAVTCHRLFGDDHDRLPLVTFTVAGISAELVSTVLSAEHGIGVRDGKFCAHLLVDHLLAHGDQSTAARVSLGLATTGEQVDRFVAALTRLVDHGPDFAYVRRDGAWVPAFDQRDLSHPRPW